MDIMPISISLYIYIYIYIHVHTHMRIRATGIELRSYTEIQSLEVRTIRKGANGVSTNGVTADFMFFDRGTFWVLTLSYLYFPKSARAYLFPQSVKIYYFCSGPISVDPICPQPIYLIPYNIPYVLYSVFRGSLRIYVRTDADPHSLSTILVVSE